jgi:hypothetical protein
MVALLIKSCSSGSCLRARVVRSRNSIQPIARCIGASRGALAVFSASIRGNLQPDLPISLLISKLISALSYRTVTLNPRSAETASRPSKPRFPPNVPLRFKTQFKRNPNAKAI